ncbi:putative adhesin [Polaromonas sp. UC242_47]|uniref:putative adhesin n=1 Tax=Polaromonas sp. UC242_47 TaxID=3374626 RepID=UPI00379D7A17
MPYAKRDVGGRLYVFSSNNGLQVNTSCLIEAHGEQFFFGNSRGVAFRVPANKNVHFYVPHNAPQIYQNGSRRFGAVYGATARDHHYTTTLTRILMGTALPAQTVAGNRNCTNYVLSKIQHTNEGCAGGSWSNYWGERNDMSYDDVELMMDYQNGAKDIVTIRNRRFTSDMTLSQVIALLLANGYNYTDFHCSFCRSAQFIGSIAAVQP